MRLELTAEEQARFQKLLDEGMELSRHRSEIIAEMESILEVGDNDFNCCYDLPGDFDDTESALDHLRSHAEFMEKQKVNREQSLSRAEKNRRLAEAIEFVAFAGTNYMINRNLSIVAQGPFDFFDPDCPHRHLLWLVEAVNQKLCFQDFIAALPNQITQRNFWTALAIALSCSADQIANAAGLALGLWGREE